MRDPANASASQVAPLLPSGTLESWPAELATYLLIEPWVSRRAVLDVAPTTDSGAERLRQAGALRVATCPARAHPLPYTEASFDVVLGLNLLSGLPNAAERERCVREIARVLRKDGFCVLRSAEPTCPLHPPERTCLSRTALTTLMSMVFPVVTVLAQTPVLAFAFEAPGADELAVNESVLSGAAAHVLPSFHLAFASFRALPDEMFRDKLLTPFARPLLAVPAIPAPSVRKEDPSPLPAVVEIERRLLALQRERDALHETLMTVEDERDRLRQTVASLRREIERYLRQISEQAAALELVEGAKRSH